MADVPPRAELHQQLVAVLAEHRVHLEHLADGGVRLSVTEHDQVADQLLAAVDAHLMTERGRAAGDALRDAAKDWAADPDDVGDTPADARNWLRKRAAALGGRVTAPTPPPADDQVREGLARRLHIAAQVEGIALFTEDCNDLAAHLADAMRELLADARADELEQVRDQINDDLSVGIDTARAVRADLTERITRLRAAIRQTEGNNR